MNLNTELQTSLAGSRYVEAACSSDTVSLYSLSHCYWAGSSPFCEIVIAESPVYGKVLFLDKELQSAETDEVIYHEHLVHPVLNATASREHKRVLIVGGGEGATAREVLKWSPGSVAHVDWVDIDGGLVNLCRRHLSWASDDVYNDRRLHYYAEDVRHFLASREESVYDVIILDLPDPDVDELRELRTRVSRNDYTLYSQEFWRVLRNHLSTNGAIVTHCGPISPAGDPWERRAGLMWTVDMGRECGLGVGSAYHVNIPSFQSDWGFWMSCAPSDHDRFPVGLAVMNAETQKYAFTWCAYWNSPFIGHRSSNL
jgi:spermidine synthase